MTAEHGVFLLLENCGRSWRGACNACIHPTRHYKVRPLTTRAGKCCVAGLVCSAWCCVCAQWPVVPGWDWGTVFTHFCVLLYQRLTCCLGNDLLSGLFPAHLCSVRLLASPRRAQIPGKTPCGTVYLAWYWAGVGCSQSRFCRMPRSYHDGHHSQYRRWRCPPCRCRCRWRWRWRRAPRCCW